MESRTVIKQQAGYNRFLAGGILASVSASICCLGPLVLLATGVSGAWMSKLMLLEPYQPLLVGLALVAFAIAGKNLAASAMREEETGCCEVRRVGWKHYGLYLSSLSLALIFVTSEFWILRLA